MMWQHFYIVIYPSEVGTFASYNSTHKLFIEHHSTLPDASAPHFPQDFLHCSVIKAGLLSHSPVFAQPGQFELCLSESLQFSESLSIIKNSLCIQ